MLRVQLSDYSVYSIANATSYLYTLILSVGSAHAQTVYRVHLKLEGMIDPGVAAFVERVIAEADETEADAIVFEIDTFGGRVDAATVIRDAILDAEP